ncbi:hypothetical protein [uncultured Eubacterium sp.]|uniref:hypothetical protein n=1 Tax=uncultured Eubacterium sp. TaxID=165185 RepID=UPI002595896B|nr:hypothetical protein [uncultured Eubacterium sp.]
MKKKSIKLIIIVVFLVIILPYLFVECNTILFGDEFKNEYKQTNMISDIKYYKVFYKTKNTAKVYYVDSNKETGNYIWFEKNKSNWVMTNWETVWSEYGSASGITYPYYK